DHTTLKDLFRDFIKPHPDAETENFRRTLLSGLAILLLFATTVSLWPTGEETPEQELIPPQVAQLIMKKLPRADQEREAAAGKAGGAKATDTAVAQAFRAQALQGAVSNLLKGGMTKLLNTSDLA